MPKDSAPFLQRLPANLPIAYTLWLISLGLAVADFFFGRIFAVALAQLAGLGYWQVSFIDRLSVLLFGLAGAVLVILTEHWYRTGLAKRLLWPRFVKISAWQVGLILAGMLAAPLTGS
ncbi:MAG: hypothetical protein WAU10_15775 [Caldilineaceae bacterium]